MSWDCKVDIVNSDMRVTVVVKIFADLCLYTYKLTEVKVDSFMKSGELGS